MARTSRKPDRVLLEQAAQTCACFNFRKASRCLTQLFDDELAPTGLRSTQLVVLMTAYLLGPGSMARMAREMVMDRSTLTRNLRPLMDRGLLKVTKDEGRRSQKVELTAKGKKSMMQAVPYWKKAQQAVEEKLGDKRFDRVLGDLVDIISLSRNR